MLKKILIIDSHAETLQLLKSLPADLYGGFITLTATSGPEGIELAKIHQPDVILLDVMLPGMEGFEVCKILKGHETLHDIPVVVFAEGRENKVRAIEAGVDGFLNKPIDEDDLIIHLNAMLKIREANDNRKSEKHRLEELVAKRTGELQEKLRLNRETNVRLSESNKRLEAFLQISRKITTTTDQAELMQEVVDNATSTVGVESGALYLILDKDTISLAATVPALPEDLPQEFRIASIKDHPHIRQVLTTNSHVLMEDSQTTALTPAEQEIVLKRNLRSILYLPISLWDTMIGVLILGSTFKKHTFTGEEIALLHGFTHQAAQISENVKNFEKTKEYARKLELEISERRRTEEALQESEERYRKLISTVPDIIVLTDVTGNITFINEIPFPSLKNIPNDTFLGRNMLSFISEEDLPRAVENTRLMFERKLGPKEYKLELENGFVIDSEVNGDVIYDASHTPTGLVYVVRDITGRKQAEAALRIGEERFKSIIALSRTGAWEYHGDTGYLWCSREYFIMLGRNPEDFVMDGSANLRETWIDLLHPEDRERATGHFEDYLTGGSAGMYESYFRLRHSNGNWVWIWSRGQTLRGSDGNLTNLTLGTHIDITGRKQAEEELIRAKDKVEINEKKLKNALEIGKMGSWELDIISGLFTFTDNFYQIFHTTAQEMGGYQMTVEEYARLFVHPDDVSIVSEETRLAIESDDPGFSKSIEHRILYHDGGIGHISVRFFVVKDESGNTIKTYGVNQDITEKKLAEEELIKAKEKAEESDRLKSAFLANMRYEIRTPMNGILGFAELLKEPDLTGDEQQQYIGIIEKSGQRMLSIINDIVDISKIEAGLTELHISVSNINDQLDFIYNFFKPEAAAKGLNLSVVKSVTRHEAAVHTDREKLYAILTNLVKNAIKYTGKGDIEIGCRRKAKFLEFYVKDTGIGIPRSRQKAIFERFIQADIEDRMAYQGAGLGLSISRAYVEMLGGELWVESEEGKGSTFFFTLPTTPKQRVYSRTRE